jgi:tRNA(Phe) wybutosine-synthesizing methylase Tyw3
MLYESYGNKALSKRTYKWHEHFQSRRISKDDDDYDDDDERPRQIWILRSSFLIKFQRMHAVVFIDFLLNPSKRNTNEICIITFNSALLHVSAPGSHHQAKYNKHIPNY